jgi:hypothetical protein
MNEKQMILRVVRPGALDVADDDFWDGPADLVAIEVGETGVEVEAGRVRFESIDEASKHLCSILKG